MVLAAGRLEDTVGNCLAPEWTRRRSRVISQRDAAIFIRFEGYLLILSPASIQPSLTEAADGNDSEKEWLI
jgi:hypothetical protein